MTPAATKRLEAFFQAAAKAAEVELRHMAGAHADAGEVAERALHSADALVRLAKDERTRAHSALSRWQSADPEAAELPAIFRWVAATFQASIAARRMAELEVSRTSTRLRNAAKESALRSASTCGPVWR